MKKPTRPRATHPVDVRLKVWTKKTLKLEDWDFSPLLDWPDEALRKAWEWELERELGSRHGPSIKAMKSPAKPVPPMLKSYWLNELAEEAKQGMAWIPSGDNHFTTIQPIEIDWTKSRTELLEAFGNWLDSGKHSFHTSYKHASVIKRKIGQRKTAGYLAWLGDLAIYRISETAFTRPEGLKKLGVKSMSPANWEHAQARTRDRIIKHLQSLEAIARNMSRIDPARSSPDWRDYFTRL